MTTSTSAKSPSKDFRATDVSSILSYYIDSDGNCRICGHNHSFKFNYKEAKSRNDLIPILFKEKKDLEL
ncbi:MAG TPA: hypothetical protein VH500_18485 [Nitrososphaeraceae archaeon]|jgi:hypothetical protein